MMMNYFEILLSQINNREKSILFWACFILVYALTKRGFVKNFAQLIKQFLKISWIFIIEIIYFGVIFLIINWLGFWEIGMLKDTFVILLSVIFLILKYKREDVVNNKNHFIKILLENLTLIAGIEFIIGVYPFSFVFELFFVPIIIIISCFSTVANIYHKDELVSKFFDKILIIIGSTTLIWSFLGLLNNSSELLTLLNLKLFLYPFVTVLLFLPFYYLLVLLITYEWYFTSWKHVIATNMKKPEIYKVLRNKILFKANVRLYKFYDVYEKIRLHIFELEKGEDIENLFKKLN